MKRLLPNKKGLNIHVIEHLYPGDCLFLLAHGFTGSTQSHVIASVRSYLMDNKLSSVSIDFTNNLNDSDGHFKDHTVSGEVSDLESVYQAYQSQYKKIILVGHSMGCTVSLEFSLKQSVEGLLLIAPPYSMRQIIDGMARAGYGDEQAALAKWEREGTYPIYKEKNQASYPLSFEFYRDLCRMEAKHYNRITVPSVVIYSSADPVVPPADSKKLYETMGSRDKKLISIADAPHSFDNLESTKALLQEVDRTLPFLLNSVHFADRRE